MVISSRINIWNILFLFLLGFACSLFPVGDSVFYMSPVEGFKYKTIDFFQLFSFLLGDAFLVEPSSHDFSSVLSALTFLSPFAPFSAGGLLFLYSYFLCEEDFFYIIEKDTSTKEKGSRDGEDSPVEDTQADAANVAGKVEDANSIKDTDELESASEVTEEDYLSVIFDFALFAYDICEETIISFLFENPTLYFVYEEILLSFMMLPSAYYSLLFFCIILSMGSRFGMGFNILNYFYVLIFSFTYQMCVSEFGKVADQFHFFFYTVFFTLFFF